MPDPARYSTGGGACASNCWAHSTPSPEPFHFPGPLFTLHSSLFPLYLASLPSSRLCLRTDYAKPVQAAPSNSGSSHASSKSQSSSRHLARLRHATLSARQLRTITLTRSDYYTVGRTAVGSWLNDEPIRPRRPFMCPGEMDASQRLALPELPSDPVSIGANSPAATSTAAVAGSCPAPESDEGGGHCGVPPPPPPPPPPNPWADRTHASSDPLISSSIWPHELWPSQT